MMVIPLTAPAAVDARLTGSKASRLARLTAQGFRVPEGIVVTSRAFEAVATTADADTAPEAITRIPLPPDASAVLRSAFEPGGVFHGVRVAVRSSALAEDTEQASFAGMYETFLDVCGADDVVAAVQRCFASAF
jgi:pyruvate,water dikinase